MVTPELITYLEDCEKKGVRKEQTMTALLSAGWKLASIQEGLKIMEARSTPLSRPKIVFPVLHLSLSLLFIMIAGTSVTVVALNFVAHAPLGNGHNLQANILQAAEQTPSELELVQNQINRVSNITDALEIYKELSGHYPLTLQELRKTGTEILNAQDNPNLSDHDRLYLLGLYSQSPISSEQFTDLFSNATYLYNTEADNFSLSYLLRWNEAQSSVIETQFVNGWNTATKDSLSVLKHG